MTCPFNSLLAAGCATIALGLLVASAASCSFATATYEEIDGSYGVYCQGDFDLQGDKMWILAQVFLSLAIVLGTFGTVVAWLVGRLCTRQTKTFWQIVSVSAALAAVLEIPVFLLFEAEPCSNGDVCEFAVGGYLLIFSVVFFIGVTFITQCLVPPAPITSIQWQPPKRQHQQQRRRDYNPHSDESSDDDGDTLTNLSPLARLKRWRNKKQNTRPLLDKENNGTMREDDEENQEAVVGDTDGQTILIGAAAPGQSLVIRGLAGNNADADGESSGPGDSIYSRGARDSNRGAPRIVVRERSTTAASARSLEDSTVKSKFVLDEPKEVYSEDVLMLDPVITSESDNSPRLVPILASVPEESSSGQWSSSSTTSPTPANSAPPTRNDISSDEDLGSLATTVTGAESVLDNVQDDTAVETTESKKPIESSQISSLPPLATTATESNKSTTGSTKNIGDAVQKVIVSPFDLGKTVVSRAKAKRRRKLKNYHLMDDNDIESSYPLSPPIEILTINISNDSDLDSNPSGVPTEQERALIAQWNALHDDMSPVAQPRAGHGNTDRDAYLSEDESAEAQSLDDKKAFEKVLEEIYAPSFKLETIEDEPPHPKRPKRSKRKPRKRGYISASRSVASSASLLSYTIEEETAADLESSDASEQNTNEPYDPYSTSLFDPVPMTRSRSAPNLAGYAIQKMEAGIIYDDLKITGMNNYHAAEIFPRPGGSSQSSKSKISVGSTPNHTPVVTPPKPKEESWSPPTAKKVLPLFRIERAQRGEIHRVASTVSDTSSSEGGPSIASLPSRLSRKARQARQARLRRLQARPQPDPNPITDTVSDTANLPPKPPLGEGTPSRKFGTSRSTGSLSSGLSLDGTSSDAVHLVTPPRPIRSNRTTPTRSSGGSISQGSGAYYIDLLDVELAHLRRPEGGSKGEGEESV